MGSPASYFLKTDDSVSEFIGTGLYRNEVTGTLSSSESLDAAAEFIALIQNPTSLPILYLSNTNQFSYVA